MTMESALNLTLSCPKAGVKKKQVIKNKIFFTIEILQI